MKKLLELEKIDNSYFKDKNPVVVIGFFDGVHSGHKKIIEDCVKRANKINGISIILTFNEPPLNVIKSRTYKKLITSYEERINLVSNLGVDYIVTADFNFDFLKLKPENFCKNILINKFHIREIFVGSGFRFGFNAGGDVSFLKDFFKSYHIKVNVVPLMRIKGKTISSTNIRKYYAEGKINKIKNLLGRNPQITGIVVKGAGRGKQLCFPTANIDVCEIFVSPKDGVYIGTVEINDNKNEKLPAIINIGDNPTFKDSKKWIEAFIINLNEDIYNRKIRIIFLKRLRDEIIFENKEKLIHQMNLDLECAKKYFRLEASNI